MKLKHKPELMNKAVFNLKPLKLLI